MTHQCPAKGCTRTVPNHLLMCGPHWHMVPKPLQSDVWAAYYGAGVGSIELLDAQSEAIYAVNQKLAP
jgi:hypothetical protein